MTRAIQTVATAIFLALVSSAGAVHAQPATVGSAVFYNAGHRVPQSELIDLGDPALLGGEVLEGNPRISARFDYGNGWVTGGVFQVTRGVLRVTYPFTEHATVLAGLMRVTDEEGVTHTYGPGDSYIIVQGTTVLVEVITPILQKSFLNIVE